MECRVDMCLTSLTTRCRGSVGITSVWLRIVKSVSASQSGIYMLWHEYMLSRIDTNSGARGFQGLG